MDDFDREVYCIGGLPFDAINLSQTITRLRDAQLKKSSCFLTTPNLNFLGMSQHDADFRNSVIHSDVVIADGAPIVWIARLLGIPIHERVAGSTLFEALGQENLKKMAVYFFGGIDDVAAEASKLINEKSTGLTCVGYRSPGFGTVAEMSTAEIINDINLSGADFLVIALGAKKGQAWIVKNLHQIKVPIVSHLGAVINFEAKRLKRAPVCFQKIGLEWLWRIKEEPGLWKRYWHDGWFFLRLLVTKVFPHVLWLRLNQKNLERLSQESKVSLNYQNACCRLTVSSVVLDPVPSDVRALVREASLQNKPVQVDLTNTEYLSFGFFGLLLLLKKQLDKQSLQLELLGMQPKLKRLLNWNSLSDVIR
ncbi:MAG: WecB/TagA/CpsF family glycosyltransferase [Pseudomonadota bacterium]